MIRRIHAWWYRRYIRKQETVFSRCLAVHIGHASQTRGRFD